MAVPRLILASQSPRRKDLLGRLDVPFEVISADVDETPLRGEKPLLYCQRVARAKAAKIQEQHPDAVVLAADTPVIVGRRIVQSAHTEAEATAMLRLQSGRRVQVPTAVCVMTPQGDVFEDLCRSWVKFKPMTPQEIAWYVSKKDNWYGASGAFKIQDGTAEVLICKLQGSVTGIMGLPLYETAKLLRRAGVLL